MIRRRDLITKTFLIVALAAIVGCAKEKETEGICVWVFDPTEECPLNEAGDTGAEEIGETGESGDAGPGPLPCITDAKGEPRTIYQCGGEFSASIDFETIKGNCVETLEKNADLCQEQHAFGPDEEPYEMPAVMACCDVTDPIDEDIYKIFCGADLFEQICASLPERLQNYIDEGKFPIGANQAQKLQNYLADHQAECYDALYHPNEKNPGVFGPTSWLVNGGDNSKWNLLNNFKIMVNSAKISSVSLPEDMSEYQACYDNGFNNTEVFENTVPTSTGINSILYLGGAAGAASMVGPVVDGGHVSGLGGLASQATACVDPWCSSLEVTIDEETGFWTLENLDLYADGLVPFSNGWASLDVERGAIRLYHVAPGSIQINGPGGPVYTVESGDAGFLVSGASAFAVDLRWARNASPIIMHETPAGWVIDSFELEHVDHSGQHWTVTIPSTSWK
jgi:hypothetical protein